MSMAGRTSLEERVAELREWRRRKQAALEKETAVHRRNNLAREIEALDRELDRLAAELLRHGAQGSLF